MEIILIVCFLIAFGVLIYVMFSSSIALKPYKTKNPKKDINIRMTTDTASWARISNFNFLGFYTVQYGTMRGFMAAWESTEKPMYLCQYIVRTYRNIAIACDFTTIFENEIKLTTADTKDSTLYPQPPGYYNQGFSRCGFDELYRINLESEEYLIVKGGAKLKKTPIDFEECFVNSLKKENSHQLKHWYWIFLIFYFYFVRRNRWHNKTIKQQHELGMIILPNEIFLK